MDFEDWMDAMVMTWAAIIGFAIGGTIALQVGAWYYERIYRLQHFVRW